LGNLIEKKSAWPTDALYYFLTHITDGEHIAWGDRFPMGFGRRADGFLNMLVGNTTGFDLAGEIRAVLFWPYLFPDGQFVTSTVEFMVSIAMGITGDEWQAAKSSTRADLLLLLHRAGIGQRTLPERQCLFRDERWRKEWAEIVKLAPQACEKFERGVVYLERTRANRKSN
jgi:hypothetical protein